MPVTGDQEYSSQKKAQLLAKLDHRDAKRKASLCEASDISESVVNGI